MGKKDFTENGEVRLTVKFNDLTTNTQHYKAKSDNRNDRRKSHKPLFDSSLEHLFLFLTQHYWAPIYPAPYRALCIKSEWLHTFIVVSLMSPKLWQQGVLNTKRNGPICERTLHRKNEIKGPNLSEQETFRHISKNMEHELNSQGNFRKSVAGRKSDMFNPHIAATTCSRPLL